MTDTDLVTAGDSTENDKLSNPVTPDTSSENDAHSSASDGSLATMVLPELRALANRSGVKGTSGMRKSELIAAIRETRQGGHANGASPNGGTGGESENTHDTKTANNHSESAVEEAPRTDSGERPSSGDNAGEQQPPERQEATERERQAGPRPAGQVRRPRIRQGLRPWWRPTGLRRTTEPRRLEPEPARRRR